MTGLHVLLASFLRSRFEPEIVPDDERNGDDRQSNYYPATLALLLAALLRLLGSALGVLRGNLR